MSAPQQSRLPTLGEARAILLQSIAQKLNKPVVDLRPWVDYDPIWVDEEAYHMSRGETGVRWAGD